MPWSCSRVCRTEIWGFCNKKKLSLKTIAIRLSMSRRRDPHPRAQFMSVEGLFAIFWFMALGNVCKTVASCFCFQAHEEDGVVARNGWSVWKMARGSTNVFLFFFINHCLFIYQICWSASVAQVSLAMSKTWVRVPGLCNLQYYFSMQIPMQRFHWRSSCTLKDHCPRVQEMQIKGSDSRPMVNAGQRASTRTGKSQWIQSYWARLYHQNLQFGATPPGLPSLFFLFIFYSCFNCYFYFNYCLFN